MRVQVRSAATFAAIVASAVAIGADFATSFWQDFPLTASLVSSAIVIGFTVLVLDRRARKRHQANWVTIRRLAYFSIGIDARAALQLITPDEPDRSIPTLEDATDARRVVADVGGKWAGPMLDAGAESSEFFDRLWFCAQALDSLIQLLHVEASAASLPADVRRELVDEVFKRDLAERTATASAGLNLLATRAIDRAVDGELPRDTERIRRRAGIGQRIRKFDERLGLRPIGRR